jgi:hypothetical protein
MDAGVCARVRGGLRHGLWAELARVQDGRELRGRSTLRARALSTMRACGSLLFLAALRSRTLRVAFALAIAPVAASAQDAERAGPSPEEPYLAALSTGELDAREVARMHAALGVIAAMDHTFERADAHFHAAAALDPAVELTGAIDEGVRERFETIRRARGGLRIALSAERDGSQIVLTARHVPADLALAIEVRAGETWHRRFPWEGRPLRVEPPAHAVEVALLDAYGNRIAMASVEAARPAVLPAPALEEPLRERPPEIEFLESPWLWIGAALVVIGIGVLVGFTASGDRFVVGPPVVR